MRGGPVVALFAVLASCAPLPPGADWRPSPNFDQRRPNFVVLHQTSNDNAATALATLADPARGVSAHYLVDRHGGVVQLVEEGARAWHAGESFWGGLRDLNSASIGIELDNTGDEPFADAQIESLLRLLDGVVARHRIPRANVLGHGDVAPGRKVDPSRHFPWRRLAAAGFGLWCDNPPAVPPAGFDPALGLRALGYDGSRPAAARAAFRRHFAGRDDEAELDPGEQALLYCLLASPRRESGS